MADLQTIQDLVIRIDDKQDFQSDRLSKLEVSVEQNKESLVKHMEQTKLLKKYVDNQDSLVKQRLEKIEAPKKILMSIGKVVTWIGGISFAFIGIFKLCQMGGLI